MFIIGNLPSVCLGSASYTSGSVAYGEYNEDTKTRTAYYFTMSSCYNTLSWRVHFSPNILPEIFLTTVGDQTCNSWMVYLPVIHPFTVHLPPHQRKKIREVARKYRTKHWINFTISVSINIFAEETKLRRNLSSKYKVLISGLSEEITNVFVFIHYHFQ